MPSAHLILPGEPTRFLNAWESPATGEWVTREGIVGRSGVLSETGWCPAEVGLDAVTLPWRERGYVERDDAALDWVVVQFPLRTRAADLSLRDRAMQDLGDVFDERGLGYVDGWDRGKRAGDGRIVTNIFLLCLAGEAGCVAAMAALKLRRSDPQRASIAWRPADGERWTVRYERTSGKLPGPFVL